MTDWIPVLITALICGTLFAVVAIIAAMVNAQALARAYKLFRGARACAFCDGWGAHGWSKDQPCRRCDGTGDEPKTEGAE